MRIATLYLLLAVLVVPSAASQPGTPYWDTGFGVTGVDGGGVTDMALVGERILVAGVFRLAGTSHVNNITLFDPGSNTWTTLGGGINGQVNAVAIDDEGHIYAGGNFSQAGDANARNIARWDGTQWHTLGSGLNDTVWDLAVHEGVLYAVGAFNRSGPTPLHSIAKWEDGAWQDLGNGLSNSSDSLQRSPRVYTVDISEDGLVYVGGRFDEVGGVSALGFAIWDGSTWRAPAAQLFTAETFGVVVYDITCEGEDVYVGGSFTHAGELEVHNIARLRGGNWHAVGGGLPGADVGDIDVSPNGDIFVAGGFVAVFRNATWSLIEPVGARRSPGAVKAIDEDKVLVGHSGFFIPGGEGNPSQFLYQWDVQEEAWTVIDKQAQGIDGPVYALLPASEETFFAAGAFEFAGQAHVNSIAYWNGTAWEALGEGIDGTVYALAIAPDGDVFAGGLFYRSGALPVRNVARWDGERWHPLGEGISYPAVQSLEVVNSLTIHDGALVVGGRFTHAGAIASQSLAWWDLQAEQWQAPNGIPNGPVRASWSDGDRLYIGGSFSEIAPAGSIHNVAQWEDGTWQPMGDGSAATVSVLAGENGALYAVGGFDDSVVARWTGSEWQPLGIRVNTDGIRALAVIDESHVFVAGGFTELQQRDGTVTPAYRVASIDEDAVTPLSVGGVEPSEVHALARVGDDLVVGGEFKVVGDGVQENELSLPSMNISVYREATRTSIEQHPAHRPDSREIHVYPNPGGGKVTVTAEHLAGPWYEVRVYDLLGRTLYQSKESLLPGDNLSLPLDVSGFAAGVYVIRLTTPKAIKSTTFLIAH